MPAHIRYVGIASMLSHKATSRACGDAKEISHSILRIAFSYSELLCSPDTAFLETVTGANCLPFQLATRGVAERNFDGDLCVASLLTQICGELPDDMLDRLTATAWPQILATLRRTALVTGLVGVYTVGEHRDAEIIHGKTPHRADVRIPLRGDHNV